ncbi:MAG: CCA tRNA nucleotidyltransferase [Verrucomicrobiota bacterium]|jgi:poly(A) polymerase|nr:CCA tRNA nucleotidyltransferase [Verrucomicrobiota bacterium]MDP7049048.1 CCA tRNA nucleotidyltransferase [Verrucomicrobiota bacterium]
MPDTANLPVDSLEAGALRLANRLVGAGFQAFWVGGCVRDVRLGQAPTDYDIATDAKPDDIKRLFRKIIPVGKQFGVIIVLEGGHEYQVATFRAEGGYADGRRPSSVRFTDAREDALRRDFTINGLFYDPLADELHDWVGGQADLEARRICTIGDPAQRFGEDRLRMLRAVRFAAQLGFGLEPGTLTAVRQHAAAIREVSAERRRDELIKLFRPPHAARGLDLLHESRLLPEVLPELAATRGCEQPPEYHPEGDVFTHIRLMLSHLPDDADTTLIWAVLLHDIAKPVTQTRDEGRIRFLGHETIGVEMVQEIMNRLRFPKADSAAVKTCVCHHNQLKDAPQMRSATLRKLFLRPTFRDELALHRLDSLASSGKLENFEFLEAKFAEFRKQPDLQQPLVDGAALIALGQAPGPELGKLLDDIRQRQLAGDLTTRDQALVYAREVLG